MRKVLYPILFTLLFSFACEDPDEPATVCDVSDPLSELEWLAEKKEVASEGEFSIYSHITQAHYSGEIVFYVGNCCPTCNSVLVLYDCSGNVIEGTYDLEKIVDKKVIWQPEDSVCVLD